MKALRTGRFRYRFKQWSFAYHRLMRRMQTVRCAACGNLNYRIVTIQKPFWVEMCSHCGLGRTLPFRTVVVQEDEHDQLYSKDSYIAKYLKNYTPYLDNSYKRGLAKIAKLASPSSKLLDVGCGFGYFLNIARNEGYVVEGIEVTKNLALEGNDRFGLMIHTGSILDVKLEHNFDILTAWDVLEHVINVDEILNKFHNYLIPGGLLLLRVPDFSFAQMDLPEEFLERYTRQIYPLSINQHYHHFNKNSLEKFISKAGFEVLEWWPSRDNEYTPRDLPDYLDMLRKMKQYGIACEINLIARRDESVQAVN